MAILLAPSTRSDSAVSRWYWASFMSPGTDSALARLKSSCADCAAWLTSWLRPCGDPLLLTRFANIDFDTPLESCTISATLRL